MKESVRQFYGAVALFLVFVAGFTGGIIWYARSTAAAFFGWILIWLAVLFMWGATRDPRSNQVTLPTPEQLEEAAQRLEDDAKHWTGETRNLLEGEAQGIRAVANHMKVGWNTPRKQS